MPVEPMTAVKRASTAAEALSAAVAVVDATTAAVDSSPGMAAPALGRLAHARPSDEHDHGAREGCSVWPHVCPTFVPETYSRGRPSGSQARRDRV